MLRDAGAGVFGVVEVVRCRGGAENGEGGALG